MQALRVGDSTSHGGVVTGPGCPTVLIGGMPAARLGDMTTCPMVTPAPVPVPHVGGPIAGPGAVTVLIGGMPAARASMDTCICVGPPAMGVVGCPTVMIGSSAGSGGGGGGGGGAGAQAAAAQIETAAGEAVEGQHWIEYAALDSAGQGISELGYHVTGNDLDGRGRTGADGVIRRGGFAGEDDCSLVLYDVNNAKWSSRSVPHGENVTLSADFLGYSSEAVTVAIFASDVSGEDRLIEELNPSISNDSISVDWSGPPDEETDDDEDQPRRYSLPQYYFIVRCGQHRARSGLMRFTDWIEINYEDNDGNAIGNRDYQIFLSSGEVRRGRLDGNGHAREEDVPPGAYELLIDEAQG